MKKIFLFTAMLFILSFVLFAEDGGQTGTKAAIGISPEWNLNSRDSLAAGAVLAVDFNVSSSFALGANATVSSDFSDITVIEPAAMFRWYLLSKEHAGSFAAGNGLFLQADVGAYLVLENDEVTPLFLGGLRTGVRLPFGNTFFIEPYGRIGYPFIFGFGFLTGIRF